MPQHARGSIVGAHLDGLREAWGSDASHCQHLVRARRAEPKDDLGLAPKSDLALGLVRAVIGAAGGAGGASTSDRLAAAERLALLRSSQLLKLEQRIAQMEADGGVARPSFSSEARPGGGRAPPLGPGRVVRSTNALLSLLASHAMVALAAALAGAVFADQLIGA